MLSRFAEYYRPADGVLSEMWRDAIFSFDANVLLNLYRYGESARDDFFLVLEQLESQIWLTHQAGHEYHENRLAVILEQEGAYEVTTDKLDQLEKVLKNTLDELRKQYPRHSHIDISNFANIANDAVSRLRGAVVSSQSTHPKYLEQDQIRDRLTGLFCDNRVGEPYTSVRLEEIYRDAEERWKSNIPPGYRDKGKPAPNKYGDVVLWYQLLDHAKKSQKPIIFVTDDRKEDWWVRQKGKTHAPAWALTREMDNVAKVPFYMYTQDRFMEFANQHLGIHVQRETIDEVREVGDQKEANDVVMRQLLALETQAKPVPLPPRRIVVPLGEDEIASARLRSQSQRDAFVLNQIWESWPLIRRAVRDVNRRIEALLASVDPYKVSGNELILMAAYDFHSRGLNQRETREVIEQAVFSILGESFSIRCLSPSERE